MKRIYSFVIFFAVIGILFSFISFNSTSASRLLVGQKVLNTELLKLDKEELVWINFWAVYDATSRDENVQFSSVLKKMEGKPLTENYAFRSVSISMDKFESIFEEVVKQDNLNFSEVIREPEGFHSKLAKELKLNNRFGNFLINSQGVLIAKDLTPDELEQMLNKYTNL